jgi:hypothetical protein
MRRHCTLTVKHVLGIVSCALLAASCSSPSNDAAAMEASRSGNQKIAVTLAKKEVARFSKADQCSGSTTLNCGTLALAYGSLAGYQILDGDRTAAEGSFSSAKSALRRTAAANRASATAMVYRDVSEAYWKVGEQARAAALIKEGRAAGGDEWLFTGSAAKLAYPDATPDSLPPAIPVDRSERS